MVQLSDSNNKHYARVDEQGFLLVCMCDKTCEYHANLKDLLDKGYSVVLHVHDEDGNVIPLTKKDIK